MITLVQVYLKLPILRIKKKILKFVLEVQTGK